MTKGEALADREFVKRVATEANSMKAYDIDALDALYPELFDTVSADVSFIFSDRVVAPSERNEVMRHLASVIIAKLWAKRGSVDPDVDARVRAHEAEAYEWLASAKSLSEVRTSTRPAAFTATAPTSPDVTGKTNG